MSGMAIGACDLILGIEGEVIGQQPAQNIVILGLVAIGALEIPVIRLVEKGRIDQIIRIHPLPDVSSDTFVKIGEVFEPMTFKAFFILFEIGRGRDLFLCGKAEKHQQQKGDC